MEAVTPLLLYLVLISVSVGATRRLAGGKRMSLSEIITSFGTALAVVVVMYDVGLLLGFSIAPFDNPLTKYGLVGGLALGFLVPPKSQKESAT